MSSKHTKKFNESKKIDEDSDEEDGEKRHYSKSKTIQ